MRIIEDRHLYRVGLELEFVVCNADELFPVSMLDHTAISTMKENDIKSSFIMSKDERRRLTSILKYNGILRGSSYYDHEDTDKILSGIGAAKMIAALKLRPKHGKWFTHGRLQGYIDRTDDINQMLDELDPTDYDAVAKVARTLSRCFVLMPQGESDYSMDEEKSDYIMTAVADHFSRILAVRMIPFTREWLKKNRGSEGLFSLEREHPKKHWGWYLKTEDVDEVEDCRCEIGLEIVTPPLHPDVLFMYLHMILAGLGNSEMRFKIRVGKDCGVHANISHVDYMPHDISPTFIALMFDDVPVLKRFNRFDDDNNSYRENAVETIHNLVREKLICLSDLDTPEGVRYTTNMIDAIINKYGSRTVEFDKVWTYRYVEHRYPGGKDYINQGPEIQELIEDLLALTSLYRGRNTNTEYVRRLREIMIEAGAKPEDQIVKLPRRILPR